MCLMPTCKKVMYEMVVMPNKILISYFNCNRYEKKLCYHRYITNYLVRIYLETSCSFKCD